MTTERLTKTIFNAECTIQTDPWCAAFHTTSSDKLKMDSDETTTEMHF
jgi:hypothetical protein